MVSDLPKVYSEPFADPSQIPTILLFRLTRQHVTIALSGDGGDEIFGGYNRYIFAPDLWRVSALLPGPARRAVRAATARLQAVVANEQSLLPAMAGYLGLPLTTADKLSKYGGAVARVQDFKALYRDIASTFSNLMLEPIAEPGGTGLDNVSDRILGRQEWMMAMDAVTYLPGDILVKVDRAAMSASLETRAPFLDQRVVELAWRLPLDAKIKGRTGKRIIRDILYRHVPRGLIERPKQGFAIPLDRWLRGNLQGWAESLLCPDQIAATGVFDPQKMVTLWRDHQSRKDNVGWRLWAVLMLQSWLLHYQRSTEHRRVSERA